MAVLREGRARESAPPFLNRSEPGADDAGAGALQSFSVAATKPRKSCNHGGPAAAGVDMPRALAPVWSAFVAVLLCSAALPAQAEPVSAADTRAVRAVVEAQLEAFAADDAKKAFSYAAPSIREMFGTPERFVAMVRAGYPVVYRPASITFLQPLWVQGRLVQGVRLTDADGGQWLATYGLERQPDRSWRISGYDVQPASGRMT
jgi:hypothetical protein